MSSSPHSPPRAELKRVRFGRPTKPRTEVLAPIEAIDKAQREMCLVEEELKLLTSQMPVALKKDPMKLVDCHYFQNKYPGLCIRRSHVVPLPNKVATSLASAPLNVRTPNPDTGAPSCAEGHSLTGSDYKWHSEFVERSVKLQNLAMLQAQIELLYEVHLACVVRHTYSGWNWEQFSQVAAS
ncbi:hypothetical protein MMC13_003052 [Lambiella insularis]|nr:hypothetical protein [Lambiella insularis]